MSFPKSLKDFSPVETCCLRRQQLSHMWKETCPIEDRSMYILLTDQHSASPTLYDLCYLVLEVLCIIPLAPSESIGNREEHGYNDQYVS